MKMYQNIIISILIIVIFIDPIFSFPKSLVWTGGPMYLDCDHSSDLWTPSGQYVKENVIAIKALSHSDKIYVITPRLMMKISTNQYQLGFRKYRVLGRPQKYSLTLIINDFIIEKEYSEYQHKPEAAALIILDRIKHGVLATVWQIVQENGCVELKPFPNMKAHKMADCGAVQNAVDVHIDHLGQLWILDSGIIDTNNQPQCMCPPKVVVISVVLKKVTKYVDLSSLTKPSTQLQNIAVEYGIGGKPFVYVSDASRGAILVYDILEDSGWVVLACAPTTGLQFALVKRTLGHSVLFLVRLQYAGIIELDTSILRRKMSPSTVTVLGGDTKPISLLGFDAHHLYFRHVECSDVLSWDTRQPFDASHHRDIHSPGPCLIPTSVTADPLKPLLVVLESDFGDTVLGNLPTYHRINFISTI